MLVNNNRVYSSKLACLLSPCPTLGSRWCNVTAQLQHLPSLSNTGPGVPGSRAGRAMSGMLWYVIHWPLAGQCELWERNTTPLIPELWSCECGVRWGGTSGAWCWCWCQPRLLRTLSPICLPASSPDWHGHFSRAGHVVWMIGRHFFSYFAAFFGLNCLNQHRSHRQPYLLHCSAVPLLSQQAACLKVEAPGCCTAPCRAAAEVATV